MMKNIFQDLKRKDHKRYLGGLDVFKYIGPGLLVTVGFIDPGNWASNFAAGSEFGYSLLWVVTLSTIMLIVLQHNVAHLGIVTGLCLSEAATKYTPKWVSRPILGTAVLASISTSLAEILGGAIALEMLFDMPIMWGAVLTTLFVSIMLFTNSYKKIERSIIAFVSVIGLSFIYELFLVEIDWPAATMGWVTPSFPKGSMLIIMSVLGAVVMPHNLFLHSEVIQSHEYNKKDDASIKKVLKYELFDTLFSMIVGWAINSAMILLAAATFFKSGIQVEELQQAKSLLEPLLGSNAAIVFALALLMAGISSTCCHSTCYGRRNTCNRICIGSVDGRYFVYHNKWNGSRFYLCRYLRRILSHQRQPLAGGGNPVAGNCAVTDFLYWRSFQGIIDLADDIEYPVAFYGIPAGRADFIPKSNGKLCQ